MSKWSEIYRKKEIPNIDKINSNKSYINTAPNVSPVCIKNKDDKSINQKKEHNQHLKKEVENTEKLNIIALEENLDVNNTTPVKKYNTEAYYPTTMDKAWRLAENLLTNKITANRKLLLTIAKKYKDTPNADFLRFYNDNDVLLIENVPSLEAGVSCSNEAKPANAVQVAYFVRDFKTEEIYFPKTTDEAWTLVKKLLPKDLVKKATGATLHTP